MLAALAAGLSPLSIVATVIAVLAAAESGSPWFIVVPPVFVFGYGGIPAVFGAVAIVALHRWQPDLFRSRRNFITIGALIGFLSFMVSFAVLSLDLSILKKDDPFSLTTSLLLLIVSAFYGGSAGAVGGCVYHGLLLGKYRIIGWLMVGLAVIAVAPIVWVITAGLH